MQLNELTESAEDMKEQPQEPQECSKFENLEDFKALAISSYFAGPMYFIGWPEVGENTLSFVGVAIVF